MKYLLKILKIICIFILIIAIILIIDYLRLNVSYLINKKDYKESFKVYGNKNNYVPQGLTYSDKYNIVLQTSYNSKHKVSMLYVIDFKTKKLIKELKIKEIDLSNNINHVGGIATNNEKVWITNDFEINEFDLNAILNTKKDYIQSINNNKIPNRGDFCTYKDGYLWIGDFFLNPFYKVKDNNPLLMKYNTNEEINYYKPELIISLPKMVQGMVITDDNKFVFTESFTNLIKSNLSIYNNVITKQKSTYKLNNNSIPYYKFEKIDLLKSIKLPPMAEGLFYKNNHLYILFENSSDTYFYAYPKLKRVIIYDIEKHLN